VYPFTTTANYDYTEAFLLGLDLDAYFQDASNCINSFILFIDDTAYFQNNQTFENSWYDPILNFTAMISGNFSTSLLYCFEFGYSVYVTSETNFESFDSIGDYFLAFLFNQMGNALAFESIFNDITADQENGYLTDIAY
jgi:hypothetical protein